MVLSILRVFKYKVKFFQQVEKSNILLAGWTSLVV